MGLMPPAGIQHEITRYKEYFSDKYGSGHALKSPPHITLIPPFRLPVTMEKKIIAELTGFARNEESFTIRLENFNSFAPRVIFVDVMANDKLNRLYEKISGFAFSSWGIPGDINKSRHFNPHVTVAFKDLRKEDFHDAWPEFKVKKISFEFIADRITLFKHNGKRWEILFQAGMAGTGGG